MNQSNYLLTNKGRDTMKDFNKMTFAEINAEMERFQRQIIKQQAQRIPLTERQLKYFYVLRKAYRKINAEYAK